MSEASSSPEKTTVNIRITETFLSDVDATWEDLGYNSRSEFVRDVLRDAVKHPKFIRADLKAIAAREVDIQNDRTHSNEEIKAKYGRDDTRDRIISKLEEVVSDQWREPTDRLEPLAGAPHQKLRIGQFRLGCRADRDQRIRYVVAIRKRGGNAYRGDD